MSLYSLQLTLIGVEGVEEDLLLIFASFSAFRLIFASKYSIVFSLSFLQSEWTQKQSHFFNWLLSIKCPRPLKTAIIMATKASTLIYSIKNSPFNIINNAKRWRANSRYIR